MTIETDPKDKASSTDEDPGEDTAGAPAATDGDTATADPEATGSDTAEDASPKVTAEEAPPGRRAPWVPVVAGVLVVGLVVAAAWLAIIQQTASAQDADRAAAIATARQTVVTMTTTDPARAQQSFQQLTEMATGSFGQQLQAQSEAFVRVVQGAGVTSRSTVNESALVSGDDRRATVLVVADSVVHNAQAPQGEPRQYRMKLELDKQGDRWLVSNLDFVA